MRYPRALLVTPDAPGRYFGGVRPPVGIGYVEEYIAANGITTSALDMTAGYGRRRLMRKIRQEDPAIVGFTLMTYQYAHAYSLMQEVKARLPGIKIIVGGPHVSALEGEVLRQCPAIDYAVAGEGEIPMRDLCLGAPEERIPGLYFRSNSELRSGGPRQLVEDLDTLPFPRFSSYRLKRYTDEIEINTSRGCPFGCIFCAVSNIMGRRIRYRSAASVGDELQYFYGQGRRNFQIGDDNFLADRKRVMEILGEIEARGFDGLQLRCGQGIRADLLDREILLAMKRAGFRHLGIGVESASDRVLEVIRKGATVEQIERNIALSCELGFDVSLLFVVGTPTETLEDVEASIRLALKYPVMKAFFFNLIPFPGTELHDWVLDHDAFLAPPAELFNRRDELKLRARPFFATAEMPEADRIKAQKMTERASKRIQVRTLRRKWAALGPLGALAAQAGRFDFVERAFVGNRVLRRFLDRLIFRAGRR
jgi:radical SAM superfamily enzyme YgiQ (UPF0313 family)